MRPGTRVALAAFLGSALLLIPVREVRTAPPSSAPDPLDSLLARGGLTRADLGFLPPGDAMAFPRGEQPFMLPHGREFQREPLRAIPFAKGLAGAAERLRDDVPRLSTVLLLQTRLPGFGLYGAQLSEADDLASVLMRASERPGDRALSEGSFGQAASPRMPGVAADERARAHAAQVPAPLQAPLASLLSGLLEADAWVRAAWRRVPPEVAARAVSTRRLTERLPDGAVFFPDVEDAGRSLDAESMAYAGLKATEAAARAARELAEVVRVAGSASFTSLSVTFDTPHGLVVLTGTGSDRHTHTTTLGKPGVFLALDLGGDDTWSGSFAAATWPAQPVSVAIDLSGNDVWEGGAGPSAGAGMGGVGLVWEAAGNDRYEAGNDSQGFAQFGVGLLIDLSGNDTYRLGSGGQGAALWGSALLLDRDGDDRYEILHDGQGFGGPGGAGFLVDSAGNDRYEAVREPGRAGRPDPRADGKAATSNAQGVGIGRRGDGSDGHSWAGGLGALLDLGGNDEYRGGTFCQGAGYWFGTGLLVDAEGDDRYDAVWYAQGAAAHRALGLLVDGAGNDGHRLSGTGGAGLGFGWDFAAGLFLDERGNDRYTVRRLALGAAMQRSLGLFVDAAGNDVYEAAEPALCFGSVDDDPRWAERNPLAPAWFEAAQAGLFLDLGGRNSYPNGAPAAEASVWGTWKPAR
ncbi:MAG: hypothetical protein ABIT01_03115, partial [Thermoanaerobaculia bacterium]